MDIDMKKSYCESQQYVAVILMIKFRINLFCTDFK